MAFGTVQHACSAHAPWLYNYRLIALPAKLSLLVSPTVRRVDLQGSSIHGYDCAIDGVCLHGVYSRVTVWHQKIKSRTGHMIGAEV